MSSRVMVALGLGVGLLAAGPAPGQGTPQLDLTDPQAVAEAYARACRDGDLETMLALAASDDPLRGTALEATTEMKAQMEAEGFSLDGFFTEFLFLPVELGFEQELLGTRRQDDEAEVTLRRAFVLDQKLRLVRLEDGTWRVKVLESVKATTGAGVSFLEMQAGGGRGGHLSGSHNSLRKLQQAMDEYAADHDQRLPPADRWVDEIEPYVLDPSAFKCPAAPDLEYGYAMNAEASEVELAQWDTRRDLLLLFEWPGGERNAMALPEELAAAKRLHEDGRAICVAANGSVYTLPPGATFADARNAQELSQQCESNLRALAKAARAYAQDHEGVLPGAESWQDDLALYLLERGGGEGIFTCPAAPALALGYAINREIAGKNARELTGHDQVIIFFESDLDVPNAAGDPDEDLPREPRHYSSWEGRPSHNLVHLGGQTTMRAAPRAEGE